MAHELSSRQLNSNQRMSPAIPSGRQGSQARNDKLQLYQNYYDLNKRGDAQIALPFIIQVQKQGSISHPASSYLTISTDDHPHDSLSWLHR